MRCYRYLDYKHGLKSFETGLFKVTKPSEFNDPYDCYGRVTGNLRKEVFETYVRENFDRLCDEHENATDVPQWVFESPEGMIEWFAPRFGDLIHKQVMYRQLFDEHLRILCLVGKDGLKPESDALMWSHYADGGHGVRIELEIPDEADGYPYGLRKVEYTNSVPCLDLRCCEKWPGSSPFGQFFESCIWTKGKTWEYENEVRLMCSPHYPAHAVAPMSCDDGAVRDFVHLQPSDVKGLAFGPKVHPKQWIDYYLRYCKTHPDSDIVFERALLEPDRYCYGYENLGDAMLNKAKEILEGKAC